MIQLAEDSFAARKDPDQLDVDEKVIERLQSLHPATLSEHNDNGPVVWILVIPTTNELMKKFLAEEISEKELFYNTPVGKKYEALYLCSAMVLPEYRRKGIAKRLTVDAINKIRKDHKIKTLFVWPFSKEGQALSDEVALRTSLPIFKREK
jgi:ribosomal protein S18 acetylase RimI-like enzyme